MINAAHLHLLINHLPVMGVLFSTLYLAFAWKNQNALIKKTALFIAIGTALLGLPAYFTGEPAEKMIEALPGISEKLIKTHEEAAEVALFGAGAVIVFASIGLWTARKRGQIPQVMILLVLLASLLASVLMGRTASLGGQIRHSEIRSENNRPSP